MLRWVTGTGPVPDWINAAAEADILFYDQFMLLRTHREPVRIDWGDTVVRDERGRLSVEKRHA